MFTKLNLSQKTAADIEWDMTPDLAFCAFSAKGLREDLPNTDERVCYFFIDNYSDAPRLYLMERGTRFVNILAEIKAPLAMMNDCIIDHGCALSSKDNFPINSTLKEWLLSEVVEQEDSQFLIPVIEEEVEQENMGAPLPSQGKTGFKRDIILLPGEPGTYTDDQIKEIITRWNFYDSSLNPQGEFSNALADTGNSLTVCDERTGLLWQGAGLDLCSIRRMTGNIEKLNKDGFAGIHDWRMPTIEEAMSLMEPALNSKGLYLHSCFSKEQPFIFVAARRKPTGYWFVDYKQGKVYWSSGTVPGGFCRLCRKME